MASALYISIKTENGKRLKINGEVSESFELKINGPFRELVMRIGPSLNPYGTNLLVLDPAKEAAIEWERDEILAGGTVGGGDAVEIDVNAGGVLDKAVEVAVCNGEAATIARKESPKGNDGDPAGTS